MKKRKNKNESRGNENAKVVMYDVTRLDEIRNDYTGENLRRTNIGENVREDKLKRVGRVERRNNENVVKRIGEVRIERNRGNVIRRKNG